VLYLSNDVNGNIMQGNSFYIIPPISFLLDRNCCNKIFRIIQRAAFNRFQVIISRTKEKSCNNKKHASKEREKRIMHHFLIGRFLNGNIFCSFLHEGKTFCIDTILMYLNNIFQLRKC